MGRPKRLPSVLAVLACCVIVGYGATAAAQTFDRAKAVSTSKLISDQVAQLRGQLTSPNPAFASDLRELEGHADHLRAGLDAGLEEGTTAPVLKRIVDLTLGANEQAKAASLSPAILKSLASIQTNVLALEALYGVDVASPPPKPPAPTVVQADPCKEKVRLLGVEFASDSDAIAPASADTLALATEKLKKCEAISVNIDGYTDSTGPAKYNQELSQKRADAVKAYLIQNGIGANRLNAKGDGETDPIASNGTIAGRAENRRVELTPST